MAELLTAPQEEMATSTTAIRPAMPLSLRANMLWTLAGNVVYAGCQWAMLVLIAKLGTPDMVGQFALALAITAPVLLFTNLQLRQVQATDPHHQYAFGEYLGLRFIMITLALVVIASIVLIGGYTVETAGVILVVGLAKSFESVSDVLYGLLQQHERMDRIAISMIIKGLSSLAALGLLIYATGSVFWGVTGLAAAWALVLASYDIRTGARVIRQVAAGESGTTRATTGIIAALAPSWDLRRLAWLAWLALPLGVVMLLLSLNTNIPRYFVEHFLGGHYLGIYAALAYIVVAGTTLVDALGQAATPRLAQYYASGQQDAFRALTLKMLGLSSIMAVSGVLVALVAGKQILSLIYAGEYAAYSDVFTWIMVGAGLWYLTSTLGYAATASRRIRFQPVALIAIVLAAALTCLLLVPSNGLWGAAIATVVASATGVTAYALILTRKQADKA